MNASRAIGPITDEVAKEMLDPDKYKAGGGWSADGWYLCRGAHRCGHWGWKITERRP